MYDSDLVLKINVNENGTNFLFNQTMHKILSAFRLQISFQVAYNMIFFYASNLHLIVFFKVLQWNIHEKFKLTDATDLDLHQNKTIF